MLAKKFGGEIISADSMQVYATLRVGTARPTEEEMCGVAHHLMGFLPPDASYSVAKYAESAHAAIREVYSRGKLPILCGGTGLYIQAVVDNLQYEDQSGDRSVRDELNRRIAAEGGEALLAELAVVDPQTAARLHPNDHGRIVRALELYRTTGQTITQQNKDSRRVPSPYAVCGARLDFRDRAKLYDRIDLRVHIMVEQGLEEEARWLRDQPHTDTVRQAIGYKEWEPYFSGQASLQEVIAAIQQGSRRYAKRQLSWFRHREWMYPVYVDDGDVINTAAQYINTWKGAETDETLR